MNTPKTDDGTLLMSTDLLACPFCGQDDLLHTDRDGEAWEGNTYYVRCIKCDVRMMGKTEQDARRKWNFRANAKGDSQSPDQ
jgi:Lar family restriction alleviation protein